MSSWSAESEQEVPRRSEEKQLQQEQELSGKSKNVVRRKQEFGGKSKNVVRREQELGGKSRATVGSALLTPKRSRAGAPKGCKPWLQN